MSSFTNLFIRRVSNPIDIDKSPYDLDTFLGRCRHFFEITNPLNLFVGDEKLEEARKLVEACRENKPLPEDIGEVELRKAKVLYDSAFHPETGQKMNLIGRMSAQVPCNMLITGGMMTFYKTNMEVFLWQWINQSFNALVNFTNRSGDATFTNQQIAQSYVLATSGAVATAVGLNKALKRAPPVVQRMVPFAAVFAANCINIPLMRAQELKCGTAVYDSNNNKVGYSKAAAQKGISQVIVSRVFMAIPGMLFTPFIMNHLERRGTLARLPWITLPLQIALVGACITVTTPVGCALYKQNATISFDKLETDLRPFLNTLSFLTVATPFIMNWMELRGTICRYPWLNLPTQTGLLGLCLLISTPAGCALFKQCQSLQFDHLEPELQTELNEKFSNKPPAEVFFNKGL